MEGVIAVSAACSSAWLPLRCDQPYHPSSGEEARRYVGAHLRHHRLSFDGRPDVRRFFHGHAHIADLALHSLSYGACATVDIPAIKDLYLLQWTLAGSSLYASGNTEFRAGPDSLVIVSPGQSYRKSWSSDCLQLILRIDRACVERHLAGIGSSCQAPPVFPFAPVRRDAANESLLRLIEQVARDWDNGQVGLAAACVASSTQRLLLDLFLQQQCEPRASPVSPMVAAAIAHMRENVSDRFDIADLAARAGVSIRHLQRAFAAELSMSPLAFARALRLDLARRDLREGDDSVTDVALRYGFDHLSRFAARYRARFGEPPSRTLWRARVGAAGAGRGGGE